MALKFFWRCEGTTLDGTHDYSAGDTTATVNASAAINSTVTLVDGNNVEAPGSGSHYRFSNDMATDLDSVGSMAFVMRLTSRGANGLFGVLIRGATSTHNYGVLLEGDWNAGTGTIKGRAEWGASSAVTSAAISTAAYSTIYGVVLRWDQSNSLLKIEVYTVSGSVWTLAGEQTHTTGFTAPTIDIFDGGLRIGEVGGVANVGRVDNVFIADAYDEPLEDFLGITSYTNYGAGGGDPEGRLIGGKLTSGGLLLGGVLVR